MVCIPAADSIYVVCIALLDRLVTIMWSGLHINKSVDSLCEVCHVRAWVCKTCLLVAHMKPSECKAPSEGRNKLGYLLAGGLDCFAIVSQLA